MACLGDTVLDKGDIGFFRFGHVIGGLRHGFKPQRGENAADFAQLAGIVAGDDEFLRGCTSFIIRSAISSVIRS